MTKERLRKELEAGNPLDQILCLCPGQECTIFKIDWFVRGESIIYIPDVDLNEIRYADDISGDPEAIDKLLECCYTGNDFLEECEGDLDLAIRLYNYVDWQHPSSALPEILADANDPGESASKADASNSSAEPIYTQDEAARIVEVFDDVLHDYGIKVPSPEDAERDPDNEAALYGSTYATLLDVVEHALIDLLERQKRDGASIITGVFSGNF